MIKKAYIIVDELDNDGFEELIRFQDLLKSNTYEEIYKSHYKLNVNKDKDNSTHWYGTNLEVFLFSKYLRDRGVKEYLVLHQAELFIFNESLFIINDGKINELDINETGFFGFRANLSHPFFEILRVLLKNKGGILNKPTLKPFNSSSVEKNKFFGMVDLYKKRQKYLGNIFIPYGIKKDSYEILIDWLKVNLGNKIVLKMDGLQCCNGVSMVDFENNSKQDIISKFDLILLNHKNHCNAAYFLPYYKFKNEYRFYFIKNKGYVKIYSIKEKKLQTTERELFNYKTFNENNNFKWGYIDKINWDKFKNVIDIGNNIIKIIKYETGTLEFGETLDGKIIFFEVNSMGSPMIFDEIDEKDINEFYMDLFDLITFN